MLHLMGRKIKVPDCTAMEGNNNLYSVLSTLVPALLASHTVVYGQSRSTLLSGVKASAILGENRKVM